MEGLSLYFGALVAAMEQWFIQKCLKCFSIRPCKIIALIIDLFHVYLVIRLTLLPATHIQFITTTITVLAALYVSARLGGGIRY